jgi:hypothetical protein
MENAKKHLRILGYLFYVVAIIDIASIIYAATNLSSISNIIGLSDIEPATAKGALIALIIYDVVACLLKLFLGSKALGEVKGTYNGTAHITMSTILLVINVIGLALCIYALCTGQGYASKLVDLVVTVVILLDYRQQSKTLRESK